MQLLHQRHLLGQIVNPGRLEQPAAVPNQKGCTDLPMNCAVIIVTTVVLVWVCGSVDYLEPAVLGCIILNDLSLALAACGVKCLVDLGRDTRTSTQSRRIIRRKDASWSLNWPSGVNLLARKQRMYFFWCLCDYCVLVFLCYWESIN